MDSIFNGLGILRIKMFNILAPVSNAILKKFLYILPLDLLSFFVIVFVYIVVLSISIFTSGDVSLLVLLLCSLIMCCFIALVSDRWYLKRQDSIVVYGQCRYFFKKRSRKGHVSL